LLKWHSNCIVYFLVARRSGKQAGKTVQTEVAMTRIRLILGALMIGTMVAASSQPTYAGGRGSLHALVYPNESATFVVVFPWGQPVFVSGHTLGNADLELFVYDGDGNVWQGVGPWGRRVTRINVSRTGTFRIEVRNVGGEPCHFAVRTN
jgi:hypothetical protein